jgi:hypothetical protein
MSLAFTLVLVVLFLLLVLSRPAGDPGASRMESTSSNR